MAEQQHPNNEQSARLSAAAQQYVEHYTEYAQQLNASHSIAEVVNTIEPVQSLNETEQVAVIKELGKKNDLAAADLIQAIFSLSDNKHIRKEARSRIVQLENNDIYSEWEAPAENNITAFPSSFNSFLNEKEGEPISIGELYNSEMDEVIDSQLPDISSEISNMFASLFEQSESGYIQVVDAFVDAWSEGDYEAAYQFLASDSPLKEGLSEEEWVARRVQWAKVAEPHGLEIKMIDALKDENGQEISVVDVGWSLCIAELPEESLPELPLSTIEFKDTGRRWFWTRYTVVQADEADKWLISTMSDEAANAFRQPRAELEQRLAVVDAELQSLIESMEAKAAEEDEDEEDEEFIGPVSRDQIEIVRADVVDADVLDEEEDEEDEDEEVDAQDIMDAFTEMIGDLPTMTRLVTHYLHLSDALIAQNPQKSQDLYGRAFSMTGAISDLERGAVYAQQAAEHTTELRGVILRNLAYTYMLLAEQADEDDEHEQSHVYLDKVEPIAREALAAEDDPKTRILLGTILLHSEDEEVEEQRLKEAEACFRVAEKGPNTKEDLIEIENGLAQIAEQRDQHEAALRHYQNLSQLEPDNGRTWQRIGYYQAELKHYKAAEEALKQALILDPDDEESYGTLAYVYTELNQLPKAREIVRIGVEKNPDSAYLNASLAMLYLGSGDIRSAQKYQLRAEELDSDDPIVQDVRQQLNQVKKQTSGQGKNKSSKAKQGKHKKR